MIFCLSILSFLNFRVQRSQQKGWNSSKILCFYKFSGPKKGIRGKSTSLQLSARKSLQKDLRYSSHQQTRNPARYHQAPLGACVLQKQSSGHQAFCFTVHAIAISGLVFGHQISSLLKFFSPPKGCWFLQPCVQSAASLQCLTMTPTSCKATGSFHANSLQCWCRCTRASCLVPALWGLHHHLHGCAASRFRHCGYHLLTPLGPIKREGSIEMGRRNWWHKARKNTRDRRRNVVREKSWDTRRKGIYHKVL